MIRFLKKSDWGDYWARDTNLTGEKLKSLTLELVPKLGIQVNYTGTKDHEGDDSPNGFWSKTWRSSEWC